MDEVLNNSGTIVNANRQSPFQLFCRPISIHVARAYGKIRRSLPEIIFLHFPTAHSSAAIAVAMTLTFFSRPSFF